ncbi:MAG: phage tail protein [Acidobacteria bacterium]|nr:MAG: phage tail protein [Acidobacteriota bacterium]
MNLLEVLHSREDRSDDRSRYYGVVVGIVSNNQDPDGLGRVKVKFPWLVEQDESNWARLAAPLAGSDRGLMMLPEVDDEVLVAFEQGDLRSPYVLGTLWNGVDKPPKEKSGDNDNNLRLIKSRSGHLIVLDDTSGSEKIEIIDKTGKNKIFIDSASNKLTLEVEGDIELKAPQGKIKLDATDIEIQSSADTKIEAGGSMKVQATGTTDVKGATVNLN